MAGRFAEYIHCVVCVRVWFPGPLVLVVCVMLLAILLFISAVPSLDGSVKTGRRVKFLILDLSVFFHF